MGRLLVRRRCHFGGNENIWCSRFFSQILAPQGSRVSLRAHSREQGSEIRCGYFYSTQVRLISAFDVVIGSTPWPVGWMHLKCCSPFQNNWLIYLWMLCCGRYITGWVRFFYTLKFSPFCLNSSVFNKTTMKTFVRDFFQNNVWSGSGKICVWHWP